MRVLWILPKWPYPDHDGAKKAHMALLKNWPQEYPLDLVIFTNDPKTQKDIEALQTLIGFNNLLVLPCSRLSNALLFFYSLFSANRLPTTVKRFVTKKAIALWNTWAKSFQWDVLILDGLHTAGLFFDNKKTILPDVKIRCLRAHNVESELWQQAQDRASFLFKWVYKKENRQMQAFEKAIIATSQVIVPVSNSDADKFKSLRSDSVTMVEPIGMDWVKTIQPIQASNTLELLFIGRMDWLPNSQGLNWFLDEVWPFLKSQHNHSFTLHVVGSHASPGLVKRLKNTNGVLYHGQVPEVESYYKQVAMTIIPILIGSGTRVKAIESAQYGRSFISTSKGIEGITLSPGVDFIEANSKDEWVNALNALTVEQCAQLGGAIYDNLKQTYDRQVIQNHFVTLLNGFVKRA